MGIACMLRFICFLDSTSNDTRSFVHCIFVKFPLRWYLLPSPFLIQQRRRIKETSYRNPWSVFQVQWKNKLFRRDCNQKYPKIHESAYFICTSIQEQPFFIGYHGLKWDVWRTKQAQYGKENKPIHNWLCNKTTSMLCWVVCRYDDRRSALWKLYISPGQF